MSLEDPNAQRSRRFLVEGRVQGVSFRAYAEREARSLSLTGWVRNLPDGRVEVVASGARQNLEAFERWLWRGSPYAKVLAVTTRAVDARQGDDFEVRWD